MVKKPKTQEIKELAEQLKEYADMLDSGKVSIYTSDTMREAANELMFLGSLLYKDKED